MKRSQKTTTLFDINRVGLGRSVTQSHSARNSPRPPRRADDDKSRSTNRKHSPRRKASASRATSSDAKPHDAKPRDAKLHDGSSAEGSPGVREALKQHLAAARMELAQRTQIAIEQMEHVCVDSLRAVEATSAQIRRENERLCAENERLQAQLAVAETERAQLGHSSGHLGGGTGESPAVKGGGGREVLPRHKNSGDPVIPPVHKRPPTPSCEDGPPTMIPGAVHSSDDDLEEIEVTSDEELGSASKNSWDKEGANRRRRLSSMRSLKSFSSGDEGDEDEFRSKAKKRRSVFADADKMKQKVREAVMQKQYDVKDKYTERGICSAIAKSNIFDHLTLFIILVNAIWIMIDLDYNKHSFILDAEPIFQVAEFGFCAYFLVEIIIRFVAFENKMDCLRDAWFVFDSTLVLSMLFDTGVITLLILANGGSSHGSVGLDPTILKMFRLMKVTRVTRMLRLLRATPELMILIKGIVVAFRSVLFTLALLLIFIYLFSILFKSLTEDNPALRDDLFPSVPRGMLNLLLQGTLPDHETLVMRLWDESEIFGLLAIFFILMTSLTVMNMLVGVLVEVVGVVSSVEKEQMNVQFVYAKLQELLTTSGLDADGDMRISKAEFEGLLLNPKAARMVQEVGVDVVGLVDFSEYLFQNDATLSFPEFMDLVLQLRGSNTATVKDVVDLRKFICSQVVEINDTIRKSSGMPAAPRSRKTLGARLEKELSGSDCEQWATPRPASSPQGGNTLFSSLDSFWLPGDIVKHGGSSHQLLDEEV